MTEKQLIDKLHLLAPDIERAFKKARSEKKPGDKLGIDFADFVFNKVMRDTTITTREAEALVVLIDNQVFSEAARQHLIERLAREAGDAMERGAAQLKKGSRELTRFLSALDFGVVRNIAFWSPGAHHWYRPLHFLAIRQLVESGRITVWSMDTAGLSRMVKFGFSAEYFHAHNAFIVDKDRLTDFVTIVHEATHAIQDWRDFVALIKFLEVDAYIAEAVVAHNLSRVFLSAPAKWAINEGLLDLVLDNNANQGNGRWKTLYQNMVVQVMKDPIYGAKAVDQVTKREFIPGDQNLILREKNGMNEKEQMEKLKRALNKKHP